jgi:hypothetical protein
MSGMFFGWAVVLVAALQYRRFGLLAVSAFAGPVLLVIAVSG